MQIALTNTLTWRNGSCLLLLACAAACGPTPTPWANLNTVSERLAYFEVECGVALTLPADRAQLETEFARRRIHTYTVDAPLGGSTGDGVFPLDEASELAHGEITLAVVARCPSPNEVPNALGARSPRWAFYVDETGKVFHVEDHSLYLG